MTYRFLALVVCFFASAVFANEAQIRKVIEPKLGGAKIEGVQAGPVPGLWEVRIRTERGLRLLYTDAAATYIIDGSIHDLRTDRDLTEERLRKLNAIKFESLPLDLAVKVQRGNGKRVLAMFSDPYCPACRQFEQALAQVDDITVYYFMYPVIRPELADHSRAVWCSPDRAKAWLDLAARPKPRPSAADASCDTPIERILELGKSLRVSSTPTLFFANGERLRGGLPAAQLREVLDDSARTARATK
jgi:thiol:disulfide interchange protein DsbC